IAPGQQIKRTATAVLYGQEGVGQKVVATLEYSVANSNAVFQKAGEADFLVGSSPVSLLIDSPSEAVVGQSFDMNVTVTNNTTNAIDNVVVAGQYPFGFTPTNASPQATAGGTFWRLGALAAGQSQHIKLTG